MHLILYVIKLIIENLTEMSVFMLMLYCTDMLLFGNKRGFFLKQHYRTMSHYRTFTIIFEKNYCPK